MAEMETQKSTDSEKDARRAVRVAVTGAVMLAFGLVLAFSDYVIYLGSWPDERPFYLVGIGVFLSFMGFIALVGGLVLSQVCKWEAGAKTDTPEP